MFFFLNKFCIVFHSFLIIFILFGWLWKKTRFANLVMVILTAFSWFVLGIWYGMGYCPFTDWHWRVRRELGYVDNTNSFIKYLIDNITGLNLDIKLVDLISLVLFLLAIAASVYVNFNDWRISKQQSKL